MRTIISVLLMLQVLSLTSSSRNPLYKIVGGYESPEHAHPYIAYFVSYRNKCGATIINKRHLLTAKHCVKIHRPNRKTYVIVGAHRVKRIDAFGPHPAFIFGRDNVVRVKEFIRRRDTKDIVILRLERDLVFSSKVMPACLPSLPQQSYANMEAVATGWGNVVGYDPGQFVVKNSSSRLREVTLNVVPPNDRLCKKAVSDREAYLCAYKQGKDTCQGDSGGPLTIRQNGVYVLIGVTHGGEGCGAQGYAGIYARVSYFVNWIKDNVGEVCTNDEPGIWAQSQISDSSTHVDSSTNNADCTCSSFVNQAGYGNCQKKDSDFGGRVSCYVSLPTSCTDLTRSGSNPGKFLSSQACQTGQFGQSEPAIRPPIPRPSSTPSPRPRPSSTPSPRPKPSSTPPPFVTVAASVAPITSSGCSCSDFINKNGFGRCRKADSDFGGSVSCYVNNPSTCKDLVKSSSNPGKFLSARACVNEAAAEPPRPQYPSRPPPSTTVAAPSSSSGCSCSNFINRNGFGRCRKQDSDFGGSVSCYVNTPSTCADLVKSGSNRGKFLSAQACKNGY